MSELEAVFRAEWGRVLAVLVGQLRDLDLAEDAAQAAFAKAAERWPRDGAPDNPAGWLVRTARNHAVDQLRRRRTLEAKLPLLPRPDERPDEEEVPVAPSTIPDERLELLFLCCHPALAQDAQVALTLRAVGGLSTDEIAAALLVSPETMKKRLTRAKQKIAAAVIPFRVPPDHLLPERLAVVLAVVYLVYTQGYAGRPDRTDLAAEAVRLGRVLLALMPDEAEVHGLLALMLAHEARRAARYDGDELVLLRDQDRSRWDQDRLAEARRLARRAIAGRGPYALQAAVAVLQTEEPVDWPQVAALYAELAELTGSPVVRLNRAVAVAESGDPQGALALVDAEAERLARYPYLHSTRAELLSRLGRSEEARAAYDRALELTTDERERRFLRRRRAEQP